MYFSRVAGSRVGVDVAPPAFLRLVAHPLRWRLLRELAGSDRRVNELTALVGQPQNSVSYHLGRLRAGGLVSMHRGAADRRDSYYRIELRHCGELLAAAATALHPGLGPSAPTGRAAMTEPARVAAPRVLFLCTGNSARSQMAEALLERAAGELVQVSSAGSHPKPMHPDAVRVMREYGIDLTGRRPKHLDQFRDLRFDYVITLCDKVREVCPRFPGRPEPIHWSIPDPARTGGTGAGTTPADTYPAFVRTGADLHTRIEFLTRQLAATQLI